MKIIIGEGQQLASLAADHYARLLTENPQRVFGLATGSSPLRVYDELAARVDAGELSFSQARGFTLDEYLGLPAGHPETYRRVIDAEFVSRVDFAPGAVRGPDGTAADPDAEARAYDAAIAEAGGIDLQILGIGTNGHIAFNEPGAAFDSRTRREELAPQTRADNARFFDGDVDAVPTHCLTQGIGTILEAREIILLASGAGKADAIAQLVEGEVTTLWPATALRSHPNVTLFLDAAAASGLSAEVRDAARAATLAATAR